MNQHKLLPQLIEKCQKNPLTVGLPESLDPRTLKAVEIFLLNQSVKKVQLFCSSEQALEIAKSNGIKLEAHQDKIEWLFNKDINKKTFEHLSSIYKKKGKEISSKRLQELADDTLYQAAYCLSTGLSDISVAGAVRTTGDVIRAGITAVGLEDGIKTVSGSFIMNKEGEKTYIFGDCGVVIDPSADQLVDIASSCVSTWNTVLKEVAEPVVAFLSFSTKGSAKHQMTEKVIEAAEKFKKLHPNISSDGEFQFDAAFDSAIGLKKAPESKVPGKANIFIFPNLDAGNIAYKITQRLGGFEAYGPILQGFKRPFSDLSRGATPEDIAASVYINSLRAHSNS